MIATQTTIYVVTFEGPGSGGFNWFWEEKAAQDNYTKERRTYRQFNERTEIACFPVTVPIPNGEDQIDRITRWLEDNDVWAMSDKAEQREIVCKDY